MVETVNKEIASKELWENFLGGHPEANFLQSWNWGEFHLQLGKQISRQGFYQNGLLVGVMLVVVEDARRGRYLTVPGGPIIDWEDKSVVKQFKSELERSAAEKKAVFVRVRAQLLANENSSALFRKLGFRVAPMHLHAELTSQLDVTKTEEELLSGMRKNTRYEVKKAVSEGVNITTSTDEKEIKAFYELQLATARRQKFVPFSYRFLDEQFKVFSRDNQVLLYRADFKGELLAFAFIIFYGSEAVYHYGASTPVGREYPGAYLIQWEAIKEAKRRGLKRYNFWGVAPLETKNHRFHGLSIFKRGFGGEEVQYLRAQDLVINKPKYLVNYLIETFRRKLRNV